MAWVSTPESCALTENATHVAAATIQIFFI
jgi:hypothetical protein